MLYHKDVFWNLKFDIEALELIKTANRLSRHLQEHIASLEEKRGFDLAGIEKIINEIKKQESVSCFEVEVEYGKVTKAVIRVEYNSRKDICLVFRKGIVITAWLCNKNDNHKTLDKSKYSRR